MLYEIRLTALPNAAPQCIGQQLDTPNSLHGNPRQQIHKLRAGKIDQHLLMRIVDAKRPARIAAPSNGRAAFRHRGSRPALEFTYDPGLTVRDSAGSRRDLAHQPF